MCREQQLEMQRQQWQRHWLHADQQLPAGESFLSVRSSGRAVLVPRLPWLLLPVIITRGLPTPSCSSNILQPATATLLRTQRSAVL